MSHPEVELVEEGALLTLKFCRARKLNAINEAIERALGEAVGRLESKPALRGLVIRADGTHFSTGYDVEYRVSDRHNVGGIALRRRYREIHDLFDRIEALEKPVVAAIQGPCLGGALEMALSCDFRLASDRAAFALPEISLAVIPGSGGTSRATRLIGPAWARWLVMAGQTVDASRALQIGLVHEVFPMDDFNSSVDQFLAGLLRQPAEAVALAKMSIDLCSVLDPASSRQVERIANSILLPSAEHAARLRILRDRHKG